MKKRNVFFALLCVLLLSAAVFACSSDKPEQGKPAPPSDQTVHTHEYVPQTIAPKCAEEGYTLYTCSCGANYKENYTEPTGHTVTADACTVCGKHADGKLAYTAVSGGVEVSGIGESEDSDVIVPSQHDGKAVVAIGERAFKENKTLVSITLPESVKTVKQEAFIYCSALKYVKLTAIEELGRLSLCAPNIKNVELPNTLKTIGESAFSSLSMAHLHIPASVEQIGAGAFSGCRLDAITVDSANTRYKSVNNCVIGPVKYYEFDSSTQTNVEREKTVLLFGCRNSRIPDDGSFTEIYDGAFAGVVGLDELVIPDSIVSIGLNVFADSDMKSLKIGKGLTSISYGVFLNCEQLVKITVDPLNSKYIAEGNCLIDKEKKAVVLGCKASVIPTDPEVVTAIGANAFRDCPIPENFDIPSNITKIGNSAFLGSGLKSVTVRGNLTDADNAFSSCTSLENVYIQEGVTEIAAKMFRNTGIRKVELPQSVTKIGESAFANSDLSRINIPDSVTVIENSVFSDCTFLTQIVIPDSITQIGEYAFANCYNLVKLTLGEKVQSIGKYAFNNCYKLTELINLSQLNIEKTSSSNPENFGNLGYSVKNTAFNRNPCFYEGEIYTSADYTSKLDFVDGFVFYNDGGSYVLYSCELSGDITLPQGYKGGSYDVAPGAFVNTRVHGIKVISGVRSFKGLSVFYGTGLRSIDLSGVESIETYAFLQCGYLESVKISDCADLGEYVFYYCYQIKEFSLHNVNKVAAYTIYYGQDKSQNYIESDVMTKIAITGSCGSIDAYAFMYMTNKDAAVILSPEITKIEAYAFWDCKFDTVYFTGTREQWQSMDIGYADEGYEQNNALNTVAVYCYSESAPAADGNYWHYAADGVTPVKW